MKKNYFLKIMAMLMLLMGSFVPINELFAAANKIANGSPTPTVGTQTGTITEGVGGSVTYSVSCATTGGTGSNTLTAVYAWVSGPAPDGTSFSPTSGTLPASVNPVNYTLTITDDGTTPAGTYTFTVQLTAGNTSAVSANVTYTVDAAGGLTAPTCNPAPSSNDGYGITNVAFGSVNNSTSGQDPSPDYQDFSTLSSSYSPSATVNVDVTYSTGYTYNTKIWVDWNNDGDFIDAGEEVYSGVSLATNPTTLSTSFTVPAGATAGSKRMRIGGCDTSTPIPCYTGSYGTFEDYAIVVVPPCSSPSTQASNISFSSVTSNSMTVSWTRGNGNNVLVVAKEGSAPGDPSSGTSYAANSAYGSGDACNGGFVVYNGTATNVNATALNSGTTYYFAIYEYNNTDVCYNQTELSGSQATPMGSLDGTFSSGTSFGANGMYTVNDATNYWVVGTATHNGAPNCAYITNNGTSNAYTITTTEYSHFYFDYSFPAGATDITLDFDWKGQGETTWDGLKVYLAATTYTPTTSGLPTGTALGSTWYNQQSTWQSANITIDGANAGTTKRIIFTWVNDGSGGTQPPAAVDNIVVTAAIPCTQPTTQASNISFSSVTNNSMTVNWTRGNGNNVIVVAKAGSAPTDPLSGTSFTANAAYGSGDACGGGFVVYNGTGTSVNVTGLTENTTYYYAIYEYNNTDVCYNVTELAGNQATYCSAPTTQASGFSTSSVTTGGMTVSWTRGNGDKVLVVARQGSAVSTDPVNGTSYTASSTFGSGDQIGSGNYVVYDGTGTSVAITGLTSATAYYYAIYEYNDCGNVPYHLTQLTGNQSTIACVAPTTQASGFSATATSSSINVSWTRGNGDGVLVAIRPIAAVTADPVDGTSYTANSTYGAGSTLSDGSYVVYTGTGTSVNVTGLANSTQYYFAIYEGNVCDGGKYKTPELTGNKTTNASTQLDYDFTASSGTYTAITGGTSVSNGGTIALPFDFEYGGCTRSTRSAGTNIYVHYNGWIGLTGTTGSLTTPLTSTFYGPIIAPYGDDHSTSYGGVYWKVSGTSPNRVLTIEWNGVYSWSASKYINFQAKLYETTSKIEFIYGSTTGTGSYSGAIGINSGTTDDVYSLVDAGTNPAVNYGPTVQQSIGTFPANGQIYTWELPSPMTYNSTTVSSANTNDTYPATTNQEITGVAIDVDGSCSPFYLTQLVINMESTTLADVDNIDIYYTGTENTFSASNLIASLSPASGDIDVNVVQMLEDGTNYFWIVYDVSASATIGNTLYATCSEITLTTEGSKTVSGTGSRSIADTPDTFSKWIEDGDLAGWGRSVISASDNNIVWGGKIGAPYATGTTDGYIIKTDIDLASIIWSATIGDGGASTVIHDMVEVSDGIIAVGLTDWTGTTDLLITKIDLADGSEIWTKTIDVGGASITYEYNICLMSDGNVAISGYIEDATDKGLFLEINRSDGSIINQKAISYSAKSVRFRDIAETSDGGYILVGEASGEFYAVKLTSGLALDWSMLWGGGSTDELTFVTENAAGDYTVAGSTYSYGFGSEDGYAMRFTNPATKGSSISWTKAYGTSNDDRFNDGFRTSNDEYILTGIGTRLGDPTNDEAYVVKLNEFGSIIFTKTVGTTVSGEDQEGYGITETSDGNVALTGLSKYSDFYMVKLTSGGYCCATIQDNGSVTSLSTPIITTTGSSVAAPFPVLAVTNKNLSAGTGGVITDEGCNTALPIELILFTATCNENNVELAWSTASENNNEYFTIERSYDGSEFEAIAQIKGAGNSNYVLNYSYTDIDVETGIPVYYRLKQTDYDGEFTHSSIIAINCVDDDPYNIYPNPFTDNFTIEFGDELHNTTIVIKNSLGQEVYNETFDNISNRVDILTKNLSNGTYVVTIINEYGTSSYKVIKL